MEAFKLVQLATAYSQSLIAYKTHSAPRPFSASFAVSNRCNIHCSYCNFPNMDTAELNLDEINLLFSRLRKMGVQRLGILGGEPLFRRDILQIIRLAKDCGFSLSMNTNLLLYQKFKNDLEDIDCFFTSLDGRPEKHIANRGKQSYEKILNAIKDIVNKGKKVIAICVVTEPDIDTADYLLDLAGKGNFLIHFQPECYTEEPESKEEAPRRSAPETMENSALKSFWDYLLQRKRAGAPISSSTTYLRYIGNWGDYRTTAVHDASERCGAGRGFLFVDATGVAYPCAYTKGIAQGVNLLKDDWIETFKGETPCTKCIVGPMLEFNLLFQYPVSTIFNAVRTFK